MNSNRLDEWIEIRVEELVRDFGVPRTDAESLMRWVRNGSIAAEAEARNEDQFLLDFKRVGSAGMAERLGLTKGAVRARRSTLLKKRTPLVPALTSGG
jgi:hypothetical protein